MTDRNALQWLRKNGISLVSAMCAALMLCLVPLVFHDAFFDINRIKVYTVYAGVPFMGILMLLALLFSRKTESGFLPDKGVRCCFGAMAIFLCSCFFSYFASGFDSAVLMGNEGRYCGLLFFLCCGAAFYLIACGGIPSKWLLPTVEIVAGIIALLGVLNAMGVDPLGFYARIRKEQAQMFMSTIGHFDFFGTYLVLLLPLAGSSFVFSQKTARRGVAFFSAGLIAMGAAASRTDSALLGVHLGCIALLALAGGSLRLMSRALIVWAMGFLSLPIVGALLSFGSLGVSFSGPHALLCQKHIALAAAFVLAAASGLCFFLEKKRVRAPGKKMTVAVIVIALAVLVFVFLGVIGYFTLVDPQADLGKASGFLRFDDKWGSYRGFVYTRAMDAFRSYSPFEMLFGKGLDTTKRILKPYFDHPVIKIVGIFDDAHSQPLQLMLTGGLFAMISFVAFYVMMLLTLYRHAGRDPLLCGAAASVFAYSVVMLINVTQPILIVTYFSICALALSRMNDIAKRRCEGQ